MQIRHIKQISIEGFCSYTFPVYGKSNQMPFIKPHNILKSVLNIYRKIDNLNLKYLLIFGHTIVKYLVFVSISMNQTLKISIYVTKMKFWLREI